MLHFQDRPVVLFVCLLLFFTTVEALLRVLLVALSFFASCVVMPYCHSTATTTVTSVELPPQPITTPGYPKKYELAPRVFFFFKFVT